MPMVPTLEPGDPFPDPSRAWGQRSSAPGLLAIGADLGPDTLLQAYRHGIFPWFSDGQPILWWSTDPRMVLRTDSFAISASLKKTLRKVEASRRCGGPWQVRFDSAFEQVMRACAAPRRSGPGTWISEEFVHGYCALHQRGFAHSAELWFDGELVAGAYGVCIGRMFFGESMFTRVNDGSKVALAHLVAFLRANGVEMIDCQQETRHLASLGAAPMPRDGFLEKMHAAAKQPQITRWEPIAPGPAPR